MNVKRIEAVLNSRYAMQELECLQLGNLYVCADKTSEIGHLVYRQEEWCGELRHNGFKVRELEIAVDIDESTFNELDLKHYEIDGCDIYLFPGLAVKTGDTLEILCQKDVTIHDAVQKWEIQAEPEDFIPTVEYSIPQDERGSLAVEIENLNFGIWDSFFRCQGETVDDEERLENIAVYYRELSDGKSAGELIGCAIQGLQEMLEEYNGKLHSSGEKDYQDYYISQIESCGVFMETVKRLLGEEPDMDDSAELRQMHDNSDNSEEMEGR